MPRMLRVDFATVAAPYVAPDHSWGEKFPGRQAPTEQLTLFSVGFARTHATAASPTPCSPETKAVEAEAPQTPETGCKGAR